MTILFFLALAAVTALVLVRELHRDPARRIPSSHADSFAPRWVDAGTGRWSL